MAAAFSSEPNLSIIDRVALDSLVEMFGDDDMEAVIDLLDTFLTESLKQTQAMRTSFDSGDIQTLHRMAHSLKSSSATFGAARLSIACAHLEQAAKAQSDSGMCGELLAVVIGEQQQAAALRTDERTRLAGE